MTRTINIYEVKAMMFKGFNKETLQPEVEEKTYELENVRIDEKDPEASVEKALYRKYGAEAKGCTVKSFRLVRSEKWNIPEDKLKEIAEITVTNYDENGNEIK